MKLLINDLNQVTVDIGHLIILINNNFINILQ